MRVERRRMTPLDGDDPAVIRGQEVTARVDTGHHLPERVGARILEDRQILVVADPEPMGMTPFDTRRHDVSGSSTPNPGHTAIEIVQPRVNLGSNCSGMRTIWSPLPSFLAL